MALKKDEICIWLSQRRTDGQICFSLLSCPKNRRRDIESRLQSAALRKVKGNRLDRLDFSRLDAPSLAHCEEYLNTLFRVSDLSGFASVFYPKTGRLEADVYRAAGQFLKERYPGCSFVIFSDPGQIRSSVLQNWNRRQQLQAVFEPLDESDSIMIQSASLACEALFSLSEDPVHQQASGKAERLAGMARLWTVARPGELYAAENSQLDCPAFFQSLETLPELLSQGLLEKWLRRGLPDHFFELLQTLLEKNIDRSTLLETAPARLQMQAQALLERAARADRPFPDEAFCSWCESVFHALNGLPGLKWLWDEKQDSGSLHGLLRRLLDAWTENPQPGSRNAKESVWILEEEKQILLLKTDLMPWLVKTLEDASNWPASLCPVQISADALEDWLKALSACRPLPSCCVCESMRAKLRSWSIETNRFLPLHPLDENARQVVLRLYRERGSSSAAAFAGCQTSAPWFSKAVEQELSGSDRSLLAQSSLDIQQTRLLAGALAKGLAPEKAAQTLQSPHPSVFSLVRPYLYPRKVQAFLAQIGDPDLQRLLNRPSLRLSQMEAVAGLAAQGYPWEWLSVNLKENTTLKGIEALASIFPKGQIPRSWQFCCPIPDDLAEWLVSAAARAHPQKEESELEQNLIEFTVALASLLFQTDEIRRVLVRQDNGNRAD